MINEFMDKKLINLENIISKRLKNRRLSRDNKNFNEKRFDIDDNAYEQIEHFLCKNDQLYFKLIKAFVQINTLEKKHKFIEMIESINKN